MKLIKFILLIILVSFPIVCSADFLAFNSTTKVDGQPTYPLGNPSNDFSYSWDAKENAGLFAINDSPKDMKWTVSPQNEGNSRATKVCVEYKAENIENTYPNDFIMAQKLGGVWISLARENNINSDGKWHTLTLDIPKSALSEGDILCNICIRLGSKSANGKMWIKKIYFKDNSASENMKKHIIKNNLISVELTELENKDVVISDIQDIKNKTNFVATKDYNNLLWTLKVKKSDNFTSEEIILDPSDSEKLIVDNKTTDIKLTWKNVKSQDMSAGFDVTVTGELSGGNSLWDINVKSNTKDYGIWQVVFPNVSGLDCAKNNTVMIPNYGGALNTDFIQMSADIDYPSTIVSMQFMSLTKGKSTLYMSTHDLKSRHKIFSWRTPQPNEMNFKITNNPDYMGVGGHDYTQGYKFVIATLQGDWFDAAKKYRKWGIDNKFTPFSQGRIDERKDYPQWMKENPVWLGWHGLTNDNVKNLPDFQKFLNVPCAVHVYHWSQYPFDTHYPNWLPAWDRFANDVKTVRAAGLKVMPYTNAHLVDIKNSPTYKKYGDNLLSFGPNEKPYISEFNATSDVLNVTACPTVKEYYNQIVDEEKNIIKEYDTDAVYLDQVGCVPAFTCFNKNHNHPVGGGSHWTDTYYNMITDIRKEANKVKGSPIITTTESSSESYPFDAWLRCNEGSPSLSPVATVVYNGYVVSFGSYFYGDEFTTDNALPAINKTATQLTFGYQLGWGWGGRQWEEYPDFGKYIKGASQARFAAYKYFNMGEMVRKVNFETKIPTKNILWRNFGLTSNEAYPLVQTASFNYKDSTAIVFTNISKDTITFNYKSSAKDLFLKTKTSYNISQLYPNKKEISNGKIEGKVTIKPLETIILIVK